MIRKQAADLGEHATNAQRDHAKRLHGELQITPCTPRCAVWLLYGIAPVGTRDSMIPGRCKVKAHKPEHLGIAGRRVLVSRKWSNKTLDDHRADGAAFVRQLLEQAGIQPANDVEDGPYRWNARPPLILMCRIGPCCCCTPSLNGSDGRPNTPPLNSASGSPPDNHSATDDQAA